MMQAFTTSRNFVGYRFQDRYNNACSIQESSLATEPCIWLGQNNDRMHLTQEMAAELIEHLKHFVDTGKLKP